MICTSISNCDFHKIKEILSGRNIQMAEIRLDLCPELDFFDIERIFYPTQIPIIATCRKTGSIDWEECLFCYESAIACGAAFIDMDIDFPVNIADNLIDKCQSRIRVIRSFHDFHGCPSLTELQGIIGTCLEGHADIVKIAVTAADNWRETLYNLYLANPNLRGRLIAFAMGEDGRDSRLECLKYGAPFTYCHPDGQECTAPGQFSQSEMHKMIFGNLKFKHLDIRHPAASKSQAQRAIVAAALAGGTSTIRRYTPCEDSQHAIEFARSLGATVKTGPTTLTVSGIGATPSCIAKDSFFTGESGLLTRLAAPLASVLDSSPFQIDGCGTLESRNMGPLAKGLEAMGMNVTGNQSGRQETGKLHLPFHISGQARGGNLTINASDGSQTVTGLLFSLPLLPQDNILKVTNPKSRPYIDMTLDTLNAFGINIVRKECSGGGLEFFINGRQRYSPAKISLEQDWSGISGYLVYAAITGKAIIHHSDSKSNQADAHILDILESAGAFAGREIIRGSDTVRTVSHAPLKAFDTNLTDSPDLFPVVSVLAAFSSGESHIHGADRLHSKESDRAKAISGMLCQMGVDVKINDNVMIIRGETLESRILNGRMPKPGLYKTSHDHRMAMALLIVRNIMNGGIELDDMTCLDKSYPGFEKAFR